MKDNILPIRYDLNEFVCRHVLKEAQVAAETSFGVAGILVNLKDKSIIDVFHNQVVSRDCDDEKYRIKDPTAHGERQLVDWYFQNKSELNLPEPQDILLITSLDPCCMCTGSILSTGFKVIVVALDEQAGINYNDEDLFSSLDPELKTKISNTFIYPKVENDPLRKGFGTVPNIFDEEILSADNVSGCYNAFMDGYKKINDIINNSVLKKDLIDISTKNAPVYIIEALKEEYPRALEYKLKDHGIPDSKVADYLIEAAIIDKENGGDGDAVAFFDYFDNLILCKPGMKGLSPIKTALMETIRNYQKIRYELSKDSDEVFKYLCDPKYGTFVLLRGFDLGSQSFADMGAYSSAMFGKLDPDSNHNLQYVLPRVPEGSLRDHIKKMPPYYINLLNPIIVKNKELIRIISEKFPD